MSTMVSRFNIKNFAVIILAAGSSSRFGSPKQLLNFAGKTLLQGSIDSAKDTGADKVIVVLGSNKQLIEDKIDDEGIIIIENTNWEIGLSASIKCGIIALKNIMPDADAIILMACDQPHASSTILKALLAEQSESGQAIVACRYDNTNGIPALFHNSIFSELTALNGDRGAKKLFEKYKDVTSFVYFKDGGIDIDTTQDYENLTK